MSRRIVTQLKRVPPAALNRFHQLQEEEIQIKQMFEGQVGTSIPRFFGGANSFIVNPSNVGTGMLSRMIDTDDTVSNALMFKNLMVLSKIGEYDHEDKEIADFGNDILSRLRYPTIAESYEAMLSATGYGFSVTEIVSGLNDSLQRVPMRLATYHPSTMAFEVDQFGQITPEGVLQFVLQHSQHSNPNSSWVKLHYGYKVKNPFETPTDREHPWRIPFFAQYGMTRIPREKVIHHTNFPMTSVGNPYGKTPVRTAHLAWQLKVFVMRQAGIAVKRSASPLIWGSAPGGVANVEIEIDGKKTMMDPRGALMHILGERETDDAVVTGSDKDGYGLEAIESTAQLDQIGNLINLLDVRIFRAFLLPSLVMTDGSAGSRSLGDKHFEIVNFIAGEDAKKFGQTVVNDLIRPLIVDNFGVQDDYGKFKERPQSIEERERLANIFNTVTTAGYMSPMVKEDMAHVRSTLSLPKDADTSFLVNPPNDDEDGDGVDPKNPEKPAPDA